MILLLFSRSASQGKRTERVNATNQPNLVTSVNGNPSEVARTNNILRIRGVGLGLNPFKKQPWPRWFQSCVGLDELSAGSGSNHTNKESIYWDSIDS